MKNREFFCPPPTLKMSRVKEKKSDNETKQPLEILQKRQRRQQFPLIKDLKLLTLSNLMISRRQNSTIDRLILKLSIYNTHREKKTKQHLKNHQSDNLLWK